MLPIVKNTTYGHSRAARMILVAFLFAKINRESRTILNEGQGD